VWCEWMERDNEKDNDNDNDKEQKEKVCAENEREKRTISAITMGCFMNLKNLHNTCVRHKIKNNCTTKSTMEGSTTA
jgi:hypothetical protein